MHGNPAIGTKVGNAFHRFLPLVVYGGATPAANAIVPDRL